MNFKTKLGLGLVLLNAGIAHAGSYTMDANAFAELQNVHLVFP